MIVHGRLRIVDWRSRQLFQLCLLSSVVCLLFGTGCTTGSRRAPGRTVVEVRPTVLPARLISNFFVVVVVEAPLQTPVTTPSRR